jgi:hypothetical protein
MTRRKSAFPLVLLAVAACSRKPADTATLEKQFQEMMAGAVLVGHSTFNNRDKLSGEERYSIDSVTRLAGDTWMFKARMKLGSREVPVPIPVTIKWAGDTPVIEVTDFSIPGIGSYTARVVLYRDQYAGTWSGGRGGGQMFGKIVHEPSK